MSMMESYTSGDPASILNAQLASALSTMGDAQYWEENISPTTIRQSLASSDPSNPNSTPALLKGMKWLLASISKGRDVSDFYPHVVKLVGSTSLEVRKMVYMYLVQYADHDDTTRELSLLSINSFQRGLADSEQLIRALALRVLTSIRISDILQIQILGVQKCSKDNSPYVRKCAAHALAKLSPRCCQDQDQHEMLLDIMKQLLDEDSSTMVLTSAIVAFVELCPDRLEFLHTCFRKLCHLLTDMDEWGQVMVIDCLSRYSRQFFKEPRAWKQGTAEKIDRERRVRRTLSGIVNETRPNGDVGDGLDALAKANEKAKKKHKEEKKDPNAPKRIKRRVVKKGFYSDEEDQSTEEEVYEGGHHLAGAMRQRNVMGFSDDVGFSDKVGMNTSSVPVAAINEEADEDEELNEDHRLLLRSSMPLLKSRNAGVVLAVCSLQYYCGVSSVKVRSSIGKALVRIHRDRREIQYVVLTSIRSLVHECPSAFAPFLQDFFVMALDPSFTRLIKLDILTALALEPASIETVLHELKTYVRHGDKTFACASIRAVGTVVELARIVHDRHGDKTGDKARERRNSNQIALNCLHGLVVLSKASSNSAVVGECVIVMQKILLQLSAGDSVFGVEDPNFVQDMALKRIVVLLVNGLTARAKTLEEQEEVGSDDEADEEETTTNPLGMAAGVDIPSAAVASALWVVGEWAAPLNGVGLSDTTLRIRKIDDQSFNRIRLELCRLITKSFTALDAAEKLQAIHFASKVLVSSKSTSSLGTPQEVALCEAILALGRLEVNTDVRDRARFESGLIQVAIGLQYDEDAMDPVPVLGMDNKPTMENLKRIFLQSRPSASSLPLEDVHNQNRAGMGEKGGTFRFGTLSSLVGHRARNAYLPLPRWASEDTDSSLRDPAKQTAEHVAPEAGVQGAGYKSGGGFYDESDSDDDSSSSSSSDSDGSSSSSSSGDSYDGDDNENESTSTEEENSDGNLLLPTMPSQPFSSQTAIMNQPSPTVIQPSLQNGGMMQSALMQQPQTVDSSGDSSSDDSDSEASSSSSDSDSNAVSNSFGAVGNLIPMGGPPLQSFAGVASTTNGSVSSAADDLKGLVLEPVVVDAGANDPPDIEKDSSVWMDLVRSTSVGGLSIKARYLRGKTKTREVQLLGLIAEKPTTVCLQIRFENKRTDGGVIRHIRILQRSSSSSASHIGPKKAVVPGEIVQLKQGQMSNVILGIDFASPSDRDDSLLARFDIKFNGGSVPMEIRPNLVQLLQTCKKSSSEFDGGMAKLQGFNRVESSFNVPDVSFLTSRWLQKQAHLTPVSKSDSLGAGARFVASLPASGDAVFVVVTASEGGVGKVTVCCEQALAVNGIANSLKKSINEASTSG